MFTKLDLFPSTGERKEMFEINWAQRESLDPSSIIAVLEKIL
jgi:hypothetical protein